MRKLKRILALVLTVLMVVGLVPLSIFAVENSYTGTPYDSSIDYTAPEKPVITDASFASIAASSN